MSIIKIKRSQLQAAPGSLAQGELAYTYGAGTLLNGGDRMYIGTGDETNGEAANIAVIGGKYFTDKLDHTPGTLTANSAIIVDANSKIDVLYVDDLTLDGSTLSINSGSAANTNLILQAGNTGSIVLKSTVVFEANTDFAGQVTVDSINVEDLTDNRIVIAGSSGELEDDANFTFDGTTFKIGANAEFTVAVGTGNTQVKGTLDVDGQSTLASVKVEDLTATRITYAGTDGELVDDSGLTYTGAGANATLTIAGTLDVNTEALLATAKIEDLTDNRIVIAGVGGEIEDDANFTFDGTTFNVGQDKFTATVSTGDIYTAGDIAIEGDITVGSNTATKFSVDSATGNIVSQGTLTLRDDIIVGNTTVDVFTVQGDTGNTQIAGTLDVDGQGTIASLNVEDLTITRIVFAGTNGELEDSGNFTFTSSNNTLALTGSGVVDGDFAVDNLKLDLNTISSTNTDGNILLDPAGNGYVQVVGTNGLVIPVGNTAQQGPSVAGAIRFNDEINQFEGYSGVNWASLGGVRSVDGLTYIIAESSPGASDDTLYFYTADSDTTNIQAATLDSTALTLKQNTASVDTTTGTLVVDGGVGISGDTNIGGSVDVDGDLNVDGGDITTNLTSFNLLNATATTINAFGAATDINIGTGGEGGGETTIGHDLSVVGDFSVGNTNFTVDATTGNVETAGSVTIGGDLTVNGNTTTINVSTIEVEDALIRLASNNTTSDAVDIGIVGNYFDATANTAKITGIFRDASSDEWFLFDQYVDEDIDDNVIDTSSNTFSKGVLNTDKIAFSTTTIELTGDVAGTIDISSFGGGDGDANTKTTYSITTTVQADSVALGTDTTGDYVQSISANTATGVSVTGTGEGAVVTVSGVIANTAGQVGVASYDATNFDVSAQGLVTIDTIDGGTY